MLGLGSARAKTVEGWSMTINEFFVLLLASGGALFVSLTVLVWRQEMRGYDD